MTSLAIPNETAPEPTQGVYCLSSELSLVRPVLDRIVDRWTIVILTSISAKPRRFNGIKRSIDGITHKGLSEALKRLERNGLVTRTVLPTRPVGVEYAITDLGFSLRQPFEALCHWAMTHRQQIEDAGHAYDRTHEAGRMSFSP